MDNVYDLKAYREMVPWKRKRLALNNFLKKEVDKRRRKKLEDKISEYANKLNWRDW